MEHFFGYFGSASLAVTSPKIFPRHWCVINTFLATHSNWSTMRAAVGKINSILARPNMLALCLNLLFSIFHMQVLIRFFYFLCVFSEGLCLLCIFKMKALHTLSHHFISLFLELFILLYPQLFARLERWSCVFCIK